MEAIILAGGLGTRLQSEVWDVPKSMALINSKPFLEYLLDYLIAQGVTRVIFSTGHKSEIIQDHFAGNYRNCPVVYAIEESQLGTGGAIKNAMNYVQEKHVVVVNGDSIFFSDIKAQLEAHKKENADVTLALKRMNDIERYGTVDINPQGRIILFNEKQPRIEGLINSGVYIFNVSSFKTLKLPEKFSIEKDFFETRVDKMHFLGFRSDGYFLDIGIPEDFRRAQYEIGVFPKIDKSWTLFLDRDGVINKKRENDYVKTLDELELLPGAVKSIVDLSKIFGRIIIVSNQQGIGKKLFSVESLNQIHDFITMQVEKKGGRIDAIYFAPQLATENSVMRKPQIGMAIQAKKNFNEIDFSKSIMIGDSPSDMEFAKRTKMKSILISEENEGDQHTYSLKSLSEFNKLFNSILQPKNTNL